MDNIQNSNKSQAIALLTGSKVKLQKLVPETAFGYSVPDVIRQAEACFRDNPKLNQCDPKTIATSVRYAVQLGLNLHGPLKQAALIPYGDECKFELQYQGLFELIMRTGLYDVLKSKPVHENDLFVVEADDSISHSFTLLNRGPIIGFYSVAKNAKGQYFNEVFSKQDMDELEEMTRKGNHKTPAWKNWYSEMGRKSALKRLIKWIPKTGAHNLREINEAIRIDNEQFEPEVIELKTLDQGKLQKKEMEEREAKEESIKEIALLTQQAEAVLPRDQYAIASTHIKTDTLQECLDSIDLLNSLIKDESE